MSLRLKDYIETEVQAEKILKILADHGILKPYVPTHLIFKIIPWAKLYIRDYGDEFSGFSYRQNGYWHILLNERLTEEEQRDVLFHELYHAFNNRPAYSKKSLQYKDDEKKADYFARCLLMPARWFRKQWEETGGNIERISKIFFVSQNSVLLRKKELENYLKA